MEGDIIYNEKVSSKKTQALFLALTSLFAWLTLRSMKARRRDLFSDASFFFAVFFLFYSLNYRTLKIRITSDELKLKFGLFTWRVPVENIAGCKLDDLPVILRMGGAGIHFMSTGKRYRASLNFLEHPRVVVALKNKLGPVEDISFSTRHPNEVIQFIQEAAAENKH
jgi:hypothetical protein